MDASVSAYPHYTTTSLKPKDLVGLPWRVAFAFQEEGWYLRSDIIWAKPNPMPESVRDRPTKAHEYLFLLTKRARYYYDAEAVRESTPRMMDAESYAAEVEQYPGRSNDLEDFGGGRGKKFHSATPPGGRNRRTVWTTPTQPYKGAHFATFPEKLVEPCILAGSKPGDIVFDPFGGSGTVGAVAQRLGRRFVCQDLSAEYLELARERIMETPMGMAI